VSELDATSTQSPPSEQTANPGTDRSAAGPADPTGRPADSTGRPGDDPAGATGPSGTEDGFAGQYLAGLSLNDLSLLGSAVNPADPFVRDHGKSGGPKAGGLSGGGRGPSDGGGGGGGGGAGAVGGAQDGQEDLPEGYIGGSAGASAASPEAASPAGDDTGPVAAAPTAAATTSDASPAAEDTASGTAAPTSATSDAPPAADDTASGIAAPTSATSDASPAVDDTASGTAAPTSDAPPAGRQTSPVTARSTSAASDAPPAGPAGAAAALDKGTDGRGAAAQVPPGGDFAAAYMSGPRESDPRPATAEAHLDFAIPVPADTSAANAAATAGDRPVGPVDERPVTVSDLYNFWNNHVDVDRWGLTDRQFTEKYPGWTKQQMTEFFRPIVDQVRAEDAARPKIDVDHEYHAEQRLLTGLNVIEISKSGIFATVAVMIKSLQTTNVYALQKAAKAGQAIDGLVAGVAHIDKAPAPKSASGRPPRAAESPADPRRSAPTATGRTTGSEPKSPPPRSGGPSAGDTAGRPPSKAGAAPPGEAKPATIALDHSARPISGEAAREPHPVDFGGGGRTPRLDTGGRPVPRGPASAERGAPSAPKDLTGTGRRTGMAFNEWNAAEMTHNLRVDYDSSAGRPAKVSYDVDARDVHQPAVSARSFARDTSTDGPQGKNSAYAQSGYDRGHLAQREAFKGSKDTERAADLHTQVVPMIPELNRGAGSPWREAERATIDLAREHGRVHVEVEPKYAADPPRLRDGTPVPDTIERRVFGPEGTLLRNDVFANRRPGK
jgi:DNA/RNA non-specific endonuclease